MGDNDNAGVRGIGGGSGRGSSSGHGGGRPPRRRAVMAAAVSCVVATAAVAVACVVTPPPAPPPPALAPVGLVAVGDAGSGDAVQSDVSRAMGEWAQGHRVDALVTAGDNVYPDGNPASFEARLDGPYRGWLAGRPMWAALGNHDVAGGWGDEQLAHLGAPGRWYERVVTRDGVSLQVLVLDSNAQLDVQAQWLAQRLEAPGFRWRVVVFHHPVWSCSTHGNNADTAAWWRPVIESHHVDVVLSGHDHLYQRFAAGGTQWVVTGGGGMPLYPSTPCTPGTPAPQVVAVRHHFVALEADSGSLRVTVRTRDGVELDHFELT